MFLTFSLFSDVSRSSEVSISIYMRHPPHHQNERASNDFFLGGVKIQPGFEAKMEDQMLNIMGGTGVMHLQLCYRPQQVRSEWGTWIK
jgi:serum/glucocorticoid-regulated kinase 2